MITNEMKTATVIVSAVAIAGITQAAVGTGSVDELIAAIKSKDDKVRGPAWQGAGACGAPAVQPLAGVMTDPEFELARSAKRAMWVIVRHAGRPGAEAERKAVQAALLPLLKDQPVPIRREGLWMLSEIGDAEAITPMAALLTDAEVREDARCALTRLPNPEATKAIETAFKTAPEDFKSALAESLRARGVAVAGYPSQKLKPTKETSLRATPPAAKPGS
jgi:HEAT repeat protein